MNGILKTILALLVTSGYLFPVEFVFLPGVNTKMFMALISIFLVISNYISRKRTCVPSWFLQVFIFAGIVSLSSIASIVLNNTKDISYATYLLSMLTWLGGAYTMVQVIKWSNGDAGIDSVIKYLIGACAMQCVIALLILGIPALSNYINLVIRDFSETKAFADGRLIGIGCAFDVAGMRFSAILVAFSFFLIRDSHKEDRYSLCFYSLEFTIIAIVGNMISRTTLIGVILVFVIVLFDAIRSVFLNSPFFTTSLKWLIFSFFLACIVGCLAYKSDSSLQQQFRFAFEGFFNYFNTGKWSTRSTDILATMYVWPESLKTWLVGDGYFFNTLNDPNYVGEDYAEYYMATDVGYLRFIYYFGLIGLCCFVAFFFSCSIICEKRYRNYSGLFICLFCLQLVLWAKVATDNFAVFAVFLVAEACNSYEGIQQQLCDSE